MYIYAPLPSIFCTQQVCVFDLKILNNGLLNIQRLGIKLKHNPCVAFLRKENQFWDGFLKTLKQSLGWLWKVK